MNFSGLPKILPGICQSVLMRTWARMRELIKSTVLVRMCENALMRVWTQKPEISSSKYGWWACTRKSLKTTFFCTGWMPPCAARSSTKFHEVHVPDRTKPQLASWSDLWVRAKGWSTNRGCFRPPWSQCRWLWLYSWLYQVLWFFGSAGYCLSVASCWPAWLLG